MSVVNYQQALHQEIDQTPKEYLGALLNIVHAFRESVVAIELFIMQSIKQVLFYW